ncbi:MAG: VanZ family protein [Gammaproteobacteria bacterium]
MTSLSLASRITITLCFMAVLMLVSLIPGNHKPDDSGFFRLIATTPTPVQKALHVCFYGVLALLLVWTLDGIQSRTHRFLITLIIAVAFGAVMEWCQTRVPGRFGTVHDVALNTAGAALGLLVAFFLL